MTQLSVGLSFAFLSGTDPGLALHHFRTATGSEVDVVLEKPDGVIVAIEIKASATHGRGLGFRRSEGLAGADWGAIPGGSGALSW